MVPTVGKPVTFQPLKLVHSQEEAAVGTSISAHVHTLSALSICSTKDALLFPELAGI